MLDTQSTILRLRGYWSGRVYSYDVCYIIAPPLTGLVRARQVAVGGQLQPLALGPGGQQRQARAQRRAPARRHRAGLRHQLPGT